MPSLLRRYVLFAACAVPCLFAQRVHAQLEPMEPAPPQPMDQGAMGPAAPAAPAAPQAPSRPEYMTQGGPMMGEEPAFESSANWGEPSDHERVVGHLAVGYLGVMGLPAHDGTSDSEALLDAPVLGIRYWFNDGLGLDAGLGLGLESNGGTVTTADSEVDKPSSSLFGLGLHLGLPVSAWHTAHYNGLLIPEMNFGFSTGTLDGAAAGTGDDTSLSGLLFSVGFRAGAEFHLEFLDVPQATLQLTIGLGLALELRDAEDAAGVGESNSDLYLRSNLTSLGSAVASGVQAFFYF